MWCRGLFLCGTLAVPGVLLRGPGPAAALLHTALPSTPPQHLAFLPRKLLAVKHLFSPAECYYNQIFLSLSREP